MGKQMSELGKNENNINISYYQIYLWKFHENTLKYYWIEDCYTLKRLLEN